MSITFDDGLTSVYSVALQVLEEVEATATVFIISDLIGKQFLGQPLMDGTMLRHLVSKGWEIGSHTCTHPNLRHLSNLQIRDELRTSKERLEQVTRSKISSLAYPFGSFDDRVKAIAREHYVFARAGSCYPPLRLNTLYHSDPLELKSVSTRDHPVYLVHHLFENHLSRILRAPKIGFTSGENSKTTSTRIGLQAKLVRKWLQHLRDDQWLILNFHDVHAGAETTAYTTPSREFRAIAKLGEQFAEIVTVAEAARSFGSTVMPS